MDRKTSGRFIFLLERRHMVLRRKRSRYKGPLTTIYYNLGTATCYLLRARSLTFSKHEILVYLPSKGRSVHLIRSAKLQM